ncbi:hypothetical protein R1sor_022277 [Riccia sorocarpa]|uniref:Uncharacterized protein n=1 Tax=Riccia sorocarpa TaxID=122646 RepID=A0ABD3GL44_9MARC
MSNKGKKLEEPKQSHEENSRTETPQVENSSKLQESKPECKDSAPKKDPRVVHMPVKPSHGLTLGSQVEGFLLHPGDILITQWCRPPYDPPIANSFSNPGGHCTLFVDHEYFERRQKDVHKIENVMNKCFDDGDIILRLGSFDVYWSWSPFDPIECFEFQYHSPPANWFLFSRVQAKPLPPPSKHWNRRWMKIDMQQPDPPDTHAIVPRLGDLIIRRAEAVVWWRVDFKVQSGDILLRVGYKRITGSGYDKTLAAVEMYECRISSSKEFTGRFYITRYQTHWSFCGRDMQLYGEGLIGKGGDIIRYNGLRRPLSNRSDFQRHEIIKISVLSLCLLRISLM